MRAKLEAAKKAKAADMDGAMPLTALARELEQRERKWKHKPVLAPLGARDAMEVEEFY